MVIIESAVGSKKDVDCIGCALQKGEIKTVGDLIFEGKHFEIRQDYEILIKGFFVIASKRHIKGFADFNEDEKKEFMNLSCKLRKKMEEVLKIEFIEMLFREDTIISKDNPSHFHVAFLPLEDWMKEKSVSEILTYAKNNLKTEEQLNKVKKAVKEIKEYFS